MSNTTPLDPSAARRDLFIASFTILFFELAFIRWFGSMVIFLTFFTNLVLLSCFLGMSIGCLCAQSKRDYARHTLTLSLVAMVLGWATLIIYSVVGNLNIDVGDQQSPQQIFFGTEYRASDPSSVAIPLEVIAGLFFVLIALPFIGLGQKLGRAMDAIPNRLNAYSVDIAGSLSGIVLFGIASYLQTPPIVWMSISVVCILFLTRDSWQGKRKVFTLTTAACLLFTAFAAGLPQGKEATFWSPYYKINYDPQMRSITTNNIGHQQMVAIGQRGSAAYCLPHLLQRDAGGKPFQDVLIIGAGSGNDVQGARFFEAKNIDGVEIDPVIRWLGATYNPQKPYDDPRVKIHNDDGRSFLKRTDKKYDLVIYALVDSLVLHSGYTSLRLESYLFTQEAMDDIKARLKPGGMFAMYNFFRQGWVVSRLEKVTETTYGRKPLVISLPYRETIRQADSLQSIHSITFLLSGNTQHIEDAFAQNGSFWLNRTPNLNKVMTSSAFGPNPPPGDGWQRIAPTKVDPQWTEGGRAPVEFVPRDDWPFLYVIGQIIPFQNLRGILLMGGLSLAMLFLLSPWRDGLDKGVAALAGYKFNGRMFFLGAGFMLLETKSVVHMALLFGSTWYVNSIVFGAVLIMILLANLFVHIVKPRSTKPFYALLILSLIIGILVPMNVFLALPGTMKIIASCAVAFAPIFFAGVVFATSFRDSRQPGLDFGCNIAGVMLGGLCENLSLVMGFSNLLGVAIGFYVLSAVLQPRLRQNAPVPLGEPALAEG
jgi:hypothetical protein